MNDVSSTISRLPVKARILIVDDHVIVRQGIAQLVNREPDLDVCHEAGDADSAVAVLRETHVDLAIVDISLPGTSGIELVKLMREMQPQLPVLVMSMHDEALYSDRAFRAGAKGYVMKQEATEKLLAAIRKILNGGVYVSDRMQTVMVQRFLNSGVDETVSFIDNLTDREFEILRMIGQGLTVAEIADKLGRSAKTVEAHRANLREKLGLKRAAELARFATQWVERGN
ncbi:MAG: response regulator transcription factor [Burkholderiaceae bacterium]